MERGQGVWLWPPRAPVARRDSNPGACAQSPCFPRPRGLPREGRPALPPAVSRRVPELSSAVLWPRAGFAWAPGQCPGRGVAAVAFHSPPSPDSRPPQASAPTVSGAPGSWPGPPRLLSRTGSPKRFYSGQFTELYNYPVRGAEKRCLHLQERKLRLLRGDPPKGAKLGRGQARF